MKKTQNSMIDGFDVIDAVKIKSERAVNEAFAVLDGIKENSISLPMATEMSNAIGKANAAISNILKATFLELACEKQAEMKLRKKLME